MLRGSFRKWRREQAHSKQFRFTYRCFSEKWDLRKMAGLFAAMKMVLKKEAIKRQNEMAAEWFWRRARAQHSLRIL
jgi:hypothetical protein